VNATYDVVIVGSGFSGSILGWILAKSGLQVAIVDRGSHPRFAIGESSTPTADFLVAYLADRWQLPELRPLAAWGTWQELHPEIDCGKKRGFSYFAHSEGCKFADDESNSNSLMVAASQTDEWSDTHWMRRDVDQFLTKQAIRAGCSLFENSDFLSLIRYNDRWSGVISNSSTGEPVELRSRWIIDAAGGDKFSERWLANPRDDQWMKTRTRALFGHFCNVASFGDCANQFSLSDERAGFHVDDAAQHHVTEDGWMWMLRFASGVTSVGIVRREDRCESVQTTVHASTQWRDWIDRYPSIGSMMKESEIVKESSKGIQSHVNSTLRWSNRLSRCRSRASGPGWVALPTAYGFVDPLHSTGIAHALSGVLRVAELLVADSQVDSSSSSRWVHYDAQLRSEIEWLDLLVGGCYQALPSFESFCAYSAWYFAAAIHFERVMSQDPSQWSKGYMNCEDIQLRSAIGSSYDFIQKRSSANLRDLVRTSIAPWNDVGLLEPASGQRIAHTAPPKYKDNK